MTPFGQSRITSRGRIFGPPNRAKRDKVGERQLALANTFHAVGLLFDAGLAQVQARFRPAGTEKYELHEQEEGPRATADGLIRPQ